MTCAMCPTPLRRDQKAFCSDQCHRADRPALQEMLDLFTVTAGQWLTVSDLAIWLCGDDGESQKNLMRTTLSRLRQRGHTFERCVARWAPSVKGVAYAYRLVETAERRAAA